MNRNSSLVFLLGPTAVGKTEIAIDLALEMGGEIVSADSMQVYRGMDIGTAKPSLEERRGIPHHLLDVLEIDQTFDVAQFREKAVAVISEIQSRGKPPLVVGGSGLYVRSLTQGIFEGPGKDEKLRRELESLDPSVLRRRLLEADPAAAAKIRPQDRRRMVRALEFFMATQIPISSRQTQWNSAPPLDPRQRLIGLVRPRAEIYRRCDARVDRMFARGLVEEVRRLRPLGLLPSSTAGKAIGYHEVMRCLDGELAEPEAIQLVKQRTRHFVKRQWTWFRREPKIHWLSISESDTNSMIVSRILEILDSESKPADFDLQME